MFCKEADMFLPVDKGPDNGYHQKYTFEKSKNTYPVPWKENFEKWNEMVSFPSIAIWDWYCIGRRPARLEGRAVGTGGRDYPQPPVLAGARRPVYL